MIRTLRERWSLGRPFSSREAIAADLAPVLSLETPRDPADWPEVRPQPVPAFDSAVYPPGLPLRGLAKGLFFALLALGKELGQQVRDVSLTPRSREPKRRHDPRGVRPHVPQPADRAVTTFRSGPAPRE